ncbi:unnamed protein product, partial [Prorocentrum cordatum]
LLVVGPRFSFNYEMLTNLTSAGFSGHCKNLEVVSRATKFKLVSRCLEILEILEDLGKLFASDDACIVRAMSGWARVSFALVLLATYRSARGVIVASPKCIPEEWERFQ